MIRCTAARPAWRSASAHQLPSQSHASIFSRRGRVLVGQCPLSGWQRRMAQASLFENMRTKLLFPHPVACVLDPTGCLLPGLCLDIYCERRNSWICLPSVSSTPLEPRTRSSLVHCTCTFWPPCLSVCNSDMNAHIHHVQQPWLAATNDNLPPPERFLFPCCSHD